MGHKAMTAVEHHIASVDFHPIDIVETFAERAEWEFERSGEDQIAMAVEGAWRTYSVTLAWSDFDDMLRLVCTFEQSLPDERVADFYRLLKPGQ